MICTFCGHEFEESEGTQSGCGACGSSCRGIHCPRCGYKNIPTPDLFKKIRRLVSKDTKGE